MSKRLARCCTLAFLLFPAVAEAQPVDPFAAPEPEQPEAEAPPPWSLARDGNPLAGYQRGHFYLRDASDNFRLYPSGMLLIDGQLWAGKGTTDPALSLAPRAVVRAARIGLGGQVLSDVAWQLTLAADGQPLANAKGTNESSAAPPGQPPTSDSARYDSPQVANNRAGILDAWIDLRASDALHLMVGQFREPFGMENGTPLSSLPFHERSIATRTLASPNVRDIGAMVWGDLPAASLSYQLGIVQGDGRNRPGVDRRGDLLARFTIKPLAHAGVARGLRVGASIRSGWRQSDAVLYDAPSIRTQQGFALWQPATTDSLGRRVHVIPADAQRAVGFEVWWPLGIVDLRSEITLVDNDTREAVEGFQTTNTERTGTLKGAGGYLLASVTLWGKPRLRGAPGQGVRPRSLDFGHFDPVVPEQQVEALIRLEGIALEYDSAARKGDADAQGLDGDIRVMGLGLGVNYWASRHARLSVNYDLYRAPKSGEPDNRARLPGVVAGTGGETLHELAVRAGIMF